MPNAMSKYDITLSSINACKSDRSKTNGEVQSYEITQRNACACLTVHHKTIVEALTKAKLFDEMVEARKLLKPELLVGENPLKNYTDFVALCANLTEKYVQESE